MGGRLTKKKRRSLKSSIREEELSPKGEEKKVLILQPALPLLHEKKK